jgi:hypothetical protein
MFLNLQLLNGTLELYTLLCMRSVEHMFCVSESLAEFGSRTFIYCSSYTRRLVPILCGYANLTSAFFSCLCYSAGIVL